MSLSPRQANEAWPLQPTEAGLLSALGQGSSNHTPWTASLPTGTEGLGLLRSCGNLAA